MIAEYFQKEMTKNGYHAQVNGDSLFFPPLNMDIRFEHLYSKDYATCVKISISHPSLLPNGLHELAIGMGDSEDTRLASAANSWMQSDFPVVHSYLCPTQTDLGVKRMELVSQTGHEQLGWNVLLGPLMIMGEGVEMIEDNEHELFIELMNEITTALHSPQVIYLKCFVSKLPDGTVDADCRLLGEDWIEGTNKLLYFAERLNTHGNLHWRKQFMIIYPRPLTELKKGHDLGRDVKRVYDQRYGNRTDTAIKKWYEFWR